MSLRLVLRGRERFEFALEPKHNPGRPAIWYIRERGRQLARGNTYLSVSSPPAPLRAAVAGSAALDARLSVSAGS